MNSELKMLRILIVVCQLAVAFSRNVPVNAPAAYSENPRYVENRPYFSNDYIGPDYTYKDDIDADPENYEINVDHQKYIPTIGGRPIYIPPILKFDKKSSVKQYPQDTRPWHYWQNVQIPKYEQINENRNVMKKATALPYSNKAKDLSREYPNKGYGYEVQNGAHLHPALDLERVHVNRKNLGSNKIKNEPKYLEYPHSENSKSKIQPKPKEYDVAFNDKVGDILPSLKSSDEIENFNKKSYPSHKINSAVKTGMRNSSKSGVSNKNYENVKGNEIYSSNLSSSTSTYDQINDKKVTQINKTNSYAKKENSESYKPTQPIDHSPSIKERNNECDDCENELDSEDSVDLLQKEAEEKLLEAIDPQVRSFVFNPSAKPTDKFQSCVTPKNESGHCRYVQHCLLPNIIGAIGQFMNYVCVIKDRFVGVCCAEHPVTVIKVKWEGTQSNELENSTIVTPEECGISSKMRIVGGEKADPKNYPWMAALLTMSSGQFYCGGSLINSRYVLTAAHCTFGIPKDQILVRLGEYDFSDAEGSLGEDYPVSEIKRHGQYSRRTLNNDIALLKLSKPVNFSSHIKTICLPQNKTSEGVNATLAGWGNIEGGGPSSDVLLEAVLPVVHNKKCSDTHGLPVSENAICTLATPQDKGACNGDSGGPLMALDDESKHWLVIGVVSWGRRGCDPKFPTVYAGVSNYIDWIQTHAV